MSYPPCNTFEGESGNFRFVYEKYLKQPKSMLDSKKLKGDLETSSTFK